MKRRLKTHKSRQQSALESAALPSEVLRAKRQRAAGYAELIASGRWFTAEREAIDAHTAGLQAEITGSVRIRLFKGTFDTVHTLLDALAVPRT